jgi:hypothetical protein
MKRILSALIVVCLSPCLLASVVSSSGQPVSSVDKNAESSSFTLNNQMLGLNGPLSINATYSHNYGVILKGQYGRNFGIHSAGSLILEGGAKQYRVNLTWAYLVSAHQRIKLSIERLAQKMSFDFSSGTHAYWVNQNALGASYEYLIAKSWLHSFHVNGFYSQALSRGLSTKRYTSNGLTYDNFRRIAGGRDKSATAGFTFLPTKWTKVDADLNYDHLRYHMKYSNNTSNTSGLGLTLSLHQIITQHVKLDLVASHRKTEDDYAGNANFLLPSARGTDLGLNVGVKRVIGHHGLKSDTQYTAGVDFHFGEKANARPVFAPFVQAASFASLKDWATQPAVYRSQVFAVKDEKSVLVSTPTLNKPAPVLASNVVTIYVNARKPVAVDLAKYLPASLIKTTESGALSMTGLPAGLSYHAKTQTVKGVWPVNQKNGQPASSIAAQLDRAVTNRVVTRHSKVQPAPVLRIKLVNQSSEIYPNPTGPTSLPIDADKGDFLPAGQPITAAAGTYTIETNTNNNTTALFFNRMIRMRFPTSAQITPASELTAAGISYHLSQDKKELIFTGTPHTGEYHVDIAMDFQGITATLQHFTIQVGPSIVLTRNTKVHLPTQKMYYVGQSLDSATTSGAQDAQVGLDLTAFYDPAHSAVFSADNAASVGINGKAISASSTGLTVAKDGNKDYWLQGGLKIPATDASEAYALTFTGGLSLAKAKKATTSADVPEVGPYDFTVVGPPVRNATAAPVDDLVAQTGVIKPVDLKSYFNNDDTDTAGQTYLATDTKSISVESPESKTTDLNDSGLVGTKGLILKDGSLSGDILANAAPGTYTFTVHSANHLKSAPETGGTSAGTLTFKIVVATPITRNTTASLPGTSVYYVGQTIAPAVISAAAGVGTSAGLDLSAFYAPAHDASFVSGDASSVSINDTAFPGTTGLSLKQESDKDYWVEGPLAVPHNATQAAYSLSFTGKNKVGSVTQAGPAVGPYKFTVVGAPVRNSAAAPAQKNYTQGQAVSGMVLSAYFDNDDTDTNGQVFDSSDINKINVQSPGSNKPTLLSQSPLAGGVGVSLTGLFGGNIPKTATPGLYTITIHACNVLKTDTKTGGCSQGMLTVPLKVLVKPVRNSVAVPSTAFYYAGKAFNPDGAANLDLSKFYDPAGVADYSDQKVASLGVSINNAAPKDLADSTIGLMLNAGAKTKTVGHILSGSVALPSASDTSADYKLDFTGAGDPDNATTYAATSVSYPFTIVGPPVRNTTAAPAKQKYAQGGAVATSQLNAYFANDNTDTKGQLFDTTDSSRISVLSPGSSTPTTLAKSPLAGGVAISTTGAISGTIPADAKAGNYTLTVHACNELKASTAIDGCSQGAVNVALEVIVKPKRNSVALPSTEFYYAGEVFDPDGKANLDLSKFYDPENTALYSDQKTASINVALNSGTPTDLATSTLGLTLASDQAAGKIGHLLTGDVALAAATDLSDKYKVTFTGASDPGDQSSYASTPVAYDFTVVGPPVRNSKAAPGDQHLAHGAQMQAMLLKTYFTNDDADTLGQEFTATDAHSIAVRVPGSEKAETLNASGLGGTGGLVVSNGQLSGKILATAAPGIYRFTVHSESHLKENSSAGGVSAGSVSFQLIVSAPLTLNTHVHLPAQTIYYRGQPLAQATVSATADAPSGLDLSEFYLPAGVAVFSETNKASISINGAALQGSAIGLSLKKESGNEGWLEGGLSLSADKISENYALSFAGSTSTTGAPTGPTVGPYNLTVVGPPVRNTTAAPATQSLKQSTPIAAIILGSYFTNDDTDTTGQLFSASNQQSINVTGPDGKAHQLDKSPLGGVSGLKAENGKLTGSIPSDAAPGTYVFVVASHNVLKTQTSIGGYSTGTLTFKIVVEQGFDNRVFNCPTLQPGTYVPSSGTTFANLQPGQWTYIKKSQDGWDYQVKAKMADNMGKVYTLTGHKIKYATTAPQQNYDQQQLYVSQSKYTCSYSPQWNLREVVLQLPEGDIPNGKIKVKEGSKFVPPPLQNTCIYNDYKNRHNVQCRIVSPTK